MGLPFTRNQSYAAGVTNPSATDMNDLQDSVQRLWRAISGGVTLVRDDFIMGADGDVIAGWESSGFTYGEDTTSGDGMGVAAATPASGTDAYFRGMNMGLLSKKFRLAFRAFPAKATSSNSGTLFTFGLFSTLSEAVYFKARTSDTTYKVINTFDGGTEHDTGVTTSGVGYHVFEVRFEGTALEWAIDGAVVWSTTTAIPTFVRPYLEWRHTRDAGDANASSSYVDSVSLWAA